jgi:nucleoside-diphosphate-sugar epimerase
LRTLLIGGTGPTGPFIVKGLLKRSHEVTILNRGSHDTNEMPDTIERIIGDPHFEETLRASLAGKKFDLIIASYGRLRMIAEIAGDYTDRLISIGGSPGYRGMQYPDALFPSGLRVLLPEDSPRVASEDEFRFGYLIRISEDAVMEGHKDGRYKATHLRYPMIYGPRQPIPCEWWVVKRILDKRSSIVLPDSGLTIITRGYAENMAEAVLLTVDQGERASGKIYNCGDDHQLTMAQWVQVIARAMNSTMEIISIPVEYATPSRDMMIGRKHSNHLHYDTYAMRSDLGYKDKIPVLEAFNRTVEWYMSNPPSLNKATESNLAQHYNDEDKLIKINVEIIQKYEKLSLANAVFKHAYAHPRKPGDTKDHLGR